VRNLRRTTSAGQNFRTIFQAGYYVHEYENVLDDDEECQLNQQIDEVKQRMGMQLVIVTFTEDMVGTEPSDSLIFRIFNTWAVGRKIKIMVSSSD